MMIERQTTWKR